MIELEIIINVISHLPFEAFRRNFAKLPAPTCKTQRQTTLKLGLSNCYSLFLDEKKSFQGISEVFPAHVYSQVRKSQIFLNRNELTYTQIRSEVN